MSERFPVVDSEQLVKFFMGQGFVKHPQNRGKITLKKTGMARRLVIPANQKELSVGVVLGNLKTAGISREEFLRAFRK